MRLEPLLSLGATMVPHWHDDVAVTLSNTLIKTGHKQQCKPSKRRTTAIIVYSTSRSRDECTGCKDKPVLAVWSNIVGQRGQGTHLTSGGQTSCYRDGHGDSEKKDEVEQFLCLEINKITWRLSSNGLRETNPTWSYGHGILVFFFNTIIDDKDEDLPLAWLHVSATEMRLHLDSELCQWYIFFISF